MIDFARKNKKKVRKSDVPDRCWDYRFWIKNRPEWHPKIIKKSTPKKYAKMMAKGSKRDGKWSRNGIQNHEKIDTKFDVEESLKNP